MVPVYIPPLRQRKEDIPLLVEEFAKKLGHPEFKVPREAIDVLLARDWASIGRAPRNELDAGK